ncbi:nuclear transport factor 2 family protein [Emticicia sp. W12TSBA100-4]|uniref:nuclear transport factor 2 family protein n=1 Tax=Emticicia sp. W12TSBA100-4 TaxID=3160965 RepID=UPI003305D7E9
MKKILIVALSLMFGQMALAQSTQEVIENLERKRFAAQVSKDFDFLEKVFADDLVYTHSSGKQDDKQAYIQSIKDGKSVYDKIEVQELNVRVYGKAAVVVGKVAITQGIASGKPTILPLKYTVVYNQNGKKGWQLNTWQSLKLAN